MMIDKVYLVNSWWVAYSLTFLLDGTAAHGATAYSTAYDESMTQNKSKR
jgi:hypothetical protein